MRKTQNYRWRAICWQWEGWRAIFTELQAGVKRDMYTGSEGGAPYLLNCGVARDMYRLGMAVRVERV